MASNRFLRSLKIKNLLSFGEQGAEIELQPLNVLIGPNASGKSNLIETIGLLKAAPDDLGAPIREGGGIAEWLWKGSASPTAEIEAIVTRPQLEMPLRYRIAFMMSGHRLELVHEAVKIERDVEFYFYRYQQGNPFVIVQVDHEKEGRSLRVEDLDHSQSVLSQKKDADLYPELTYLNRQFGRIRIYREWNLGRHTPARVPQRTDLPGDYLQEDAGNLALVLSDLERFPDTQSALIEYLKKFYEAVADIKTIIQGGTVQVFLHEKGLRPMPATRLSDGTIRFLCLLVVLCHPEPPPLICIEEPELGMHPDILPTIAEVLQRASQRTQLIVTTHSDVLVSALSDAAESVVVCERDEAGTQFRRLDSDKLKAWLAKYSLGELWRMGEIGGNRW